MVTVPTDNMKIAAMSSGGILVKGERSMGPDGRISRYAIPR